MIGSTGLTVLLAFLDSQSLLRDSDDERVAFANYYLEGLRFLYSESENKDKKVCDFKQVLHVFLI